MSELEDIMLRLVAATVTGMAIGLNRDLKGKPSGMRTLALVSLGAAIVCVSTIHLPEIVGHPDATSRVVQGLIQGVLTGIGFIGAGVILRLPERHAIKNVTTAATVWITAALGIACGLAAWRIAAIGIVITFALLIFGGMLERQVHRWLRIEHEDEQDAARSNDKPAPWP